MVAVANPKKKPTAPTAPTAPTVQTPSAPKASSQDAPKPKPESKLNPKKRKADHADPPAATSKFPAKKKAKTNSVMKGITTANPRPRPPMVKNLAVEEKDELDLSSKGRDVLLPKAKDSAAVKERQNAAPSRRKAMANVTPKSKPVASRPTTPTSTTPPLKLTRLEECLPLQRMKDDAFEQLEERRNTAQLALEGFMPLMKDSEAIQTAVAALEQQVENCDRDIEKLELFGRWFETGRIKGTDAEVSYLSHLRVIHYANVRTGLYCSRLLGSGSRERVSEQEFHR
jgi:hypothetical protein